MKATSTVSKLGETTTDQSLLGRRDAHHCACVLVAAHGNIVVGDCVKFVDAARTTVVATNAFDRQAVVDPFLNADDLKPGELFWVLLLPSLVHGMHHQFDIGETVGDESPFDEEDARDEEDPDERRFENSYVGRGRGDDDGCSGSWCDGH